MGLGLRRLGPRAAGRRLPDRTRPAYSFDFSSFPTANFTAFDALILIFSPVFGFTPSRAFRFTTLDAHAMDEEHLRELLKEAILGNKEDAKQPPIERMN